MHSDSSLTVGLGDRAYDIIVGRDLLARADSLAAAQLTGRHVIIITDSQVATYHLDSLATACTRVARRCDKLTVAAGEASKSMPVLSILLEDILALGVDRGVVLVALGGGVVGRVHVSVQQKLLDQVRGDVRLDDCAEGGVAVTLRIPKVASQRMAA